MSPTAPIRPARGPGAPRDSPGITLGAAVPLPAPFTCGPLAPLHLGAGFKPLGDGEAAPSYPKLGESGLHLAPLRARCGSRQELRPWKIF